MEAFKVRTGVYPTAVADLVPASGPAGAPADWPVGLAAVRATQEGSVGGLDAGGHGDGDGCVAAPVRMCGRDISRLRGRRRLVGSGRRCHNPCGKGGPMPSEDRRLVVVVKAG